MIHVWRMPLLLAASSALGLVSALLGDGIWDALSWLTLGWPLAIILRYAALNRPRSR